MCDSRLTLDMEASIMSRGYSKQSILDTHEAFLLSLVEAEVDFPGR